MRRQFYFFLYLLLAFPFCLSAQNSSNKGTDFWVGFPAHGDGTRADMFFYITSDSNTSGTVSIPGQSWSTNFTVTANKMTLVSIPANYAYVACTDCKEDKGIHVTSQKNIVMYSHIYYRWRSDATLVLPTPTTGKEYFVMSYDQYGPSSDRSQFMIVGTQDNTKINITPSVDLGGNHKKDQTYQITLDKGEVYQGRADNRSDDVTGTHIEVIDTGSTASCKTVAVFSGSSNNFLGCNPNGGGLSSYDNLYQQLYPTKSWGSRFVTIPFKGRTADNIRIMAREDNTRIVINKVSGSPTVRTINAGKFWDEPDVKDPLYILASAPISVAQFQESQKCGGTGDPSMTILSPIEQTLKDITVYSSEYEDIDDNYINVIIPNSGISSFRIDGKTASFTKVPKLQSYSYAQLTVSDGNHRLTSDVGFIAVAYGFGRYESYGYAAGANVKDLTAQLELVNSAQNDIPSVCLGEEAEFEGQAGYSVSQWIWDYGDGTKDTGQFVEHTYADTGLYHVWLYTYKVNFDGCSSYDSADLEVRVNSNPIADFVTSLRCEGNTVSFTDSSKVPQGESILSRQWIFHDGVTYATNTTKYYDTAGTYKVSLVTKTENQCSDTMEWDMVINPNPVAGIDIDTLCFKDTAQFVNTSKVKTGSIASSKWYFGDGDSSDVFNARHFYANDGTYYVDLEVTTDSGCMTATRDTVFKHPQFSLLFTHTDTCAGLDVTFTNYSFTTGGATLGDYLWKFPGGTEYTTTNTTHQFASPGTYTIKLLGTQNNYCRDSVEQDVVVDPLAGASFITDGVCLNDSVTFISTSTVATGSLPTVTWDLDDGFTATGDTVKVLYSSGGTKDIVLMVGSDRGCADTVSDQVTLYNPLITDFSFPLVCKDESAKITGVYSLDSDTIDTYDWDVEGFSMQKDTLTYINSTPGKYTVVHTITTKFGCTVSRTDSFDVYDIPVADFTVANVCDGYNILPVNNSTIGNGETITGFEWYLNGSSASSAQNPTIVGTPAGASTLRLEVTSQAGCTNEITKDFDIYPVPNAAFSVANQCLGETTVFTSSSSVSSGSLASENWYYNDGVTDAGTVVTRTYPSDGGYSLKLVVVSDNGCPDSVSQNYNIHPVPQVDFTPDKTQGCEPLRVNFTNNSTINSGVISSYDWDFGDGNTGSGVVNSHDYLSTGTFTIVIMAESDFGCRDTFTMNPVIDVMATPTAGFSYSPLEPSLLFPDVNFNNESTPDATSFFWTTGDGATYTSMNPFHTYPEAGDYIVTLIATADNGCADTISQPLNVKLDFFIWIPTVFSPNGDNTNDRFKVHGIFSEVQGYEIQIFNRWGEVVFQSTNTEATWDGTYDGVECPAETYGFRVRYINYETGRWESKMGAIKLIR